MNLYAYVGNDPLNSRDPMGLNGCGLSNDAPIHVCGPGRSVSHIMALWTFLGGSNFAFAGDEKGEGREPRKPPERKGCPASGAAFKARANAAASYLGPVTFNSKSELALLTRYFLGDTTPYRLNAAEMAQAQAYVSTYGNSVLGRTTKRPDGLIERAIFFGSSRLTRRYSTGFSAFPPESFRETT